MPTSVKLSKTLLMLASSNHGPLPLLRPLVTLLMPGIHQETRLAVDVGGYQWLVHGHQSVALWYPHLVELVGSLELDVAIDKKLALKIKAALSQRLDGARIGALPPELILVTRKEP